VRLVIAEGAHQHRSPGPDGIRVLALDFVELLCGVRPGALANFLPRVRINLVHRTLDIFGILVVAVVVEHGAGGKCAEAGGTACQRKNAGMQRPRSRFTNFHKRHHSSDFWVAGTPRRPDTVMPFWTAPGPERPLCDADAFVMGRIGE